MIKNNMIGHYQRFIREKVDKKYFSKFKDVTVLGENFIKSQYIVIFEADDKVIL